jgi:hypothetical protein
MPLAAMASGMPISKGWEDDPSLSVWEVHYLYGHRICSQPDGQNKIGGLPVIDGKGKVVAIIAETDIFRTFVEMFAGGHAGLPLILQMPERRGVLAALSGAIADLGGSIESVGSFYGEVAGERGLVVKVWDVSQGQLVDTLEALGGHVVDARDV